MRTPIVAQIRFMCIIKRDSDHATIKENKKRRTSLKIMDLVTYNNNLYDPLCETSLFGKLEF